VHALIALDARIAFIALIFPVLTIATANTFEVGDELNSHDVLSHLVPQLALNADPDRRAVLDGKRFAVQLIGQNRLRMMCLV
jgi:hypothetical protein